MVNAMDFGAEDPWASAAREQRRAWASTSPADRLRWLDEALRFAALTGALGRDRSRRAAQAHAMARAMGLAEPESRA